MKPFLNVSDVYKQISDNVRLAEVTFLQDRLEKIAIIGETGAGKSTLLKLVAGLLQPDSGELLFEGKKIIGPADQLVPGHPGIAYLAQDFELQRHLRVEQVLGYANTLSTRESRRLYTLCHIDHVLQRKTDDLSGGEKQRVAVCRLLVSKPRLLLLDEPYSNLDMVHKAILKSVIHDIGDKLRISCIMVSHDPHDTLSWADKIIVMKDGKIVQKGTPERIYRAPYDVYVGGLLGAYSLVEGSTLARFSKIPAVKRHLQKTGTKTIFARPEDFTLVKKKSPNAIRGKVERILFFGSYYHLHVRIDESLLTVMSLKGDVGVRDVVYVQLAVRSWQLAIGSWQLAVGKGGV